MKIIRLQIPGNFLQQVGFAELFEELEFVEILNAFQYDQEHFFALQRIKFKNFQDKNIFEYIDKHFKPETFQLLERKGNEILCVIYQSRPTGFFPIVNPGPWAFIFPIHVSKEVLLINIIAHSAYVKTLFKTLSGLTENYTIIAINDIDEIKNSESNIWESIIPFPNFTKAQEEIVKFAAKNGYFNSPKRISAKRIANHFKITESAINKHIRNATNLAMEYFFGKYF